MRSENAVVKSDTAAWYSLAILTSVYLTHGLDRMIIAILLEPIKREFDLSDGQAGIMTALAYGIGLAVAGLPVGLLIDRVNRRNLLAGLAILWSATTAVCGLASNYVSLVAARMVVGAAESGGSSTPLAMIGDLFPASRRSTAIGLFYFAGPFGVGLSFFVTGMIAAQFGWRTAMVVAGLPGIICAALLLATVPEPRRGAFDDTMVARLPAASFPETLRFIHGSPILFNFIAALVIATMVQSAFANWQASLLIREYGFTVSAASSVVALAVGIFGAAGSVLGGIGADVFAAGSIYRLVVFATGVVVTGTVMAVAAVVCGRPFGTCIFLMLHALFSNAYYGASMGAIVILTGSRARGAVLGVLLVLMNVVGFGIGPYLVGLLSDLFGGQGSLRQALLIVPMINVVALAFFVLSARAARALR
jgi:predicted MFS family arabinose efflux permease